MWEDSRKTDLRTGSLGVGHSEMSTLQAQVLLDDGENKFWVVPRFGPDLFPYLSQLPLQIKPEITVWGKPGHQNRDIGFWGEGEGYRYSRQIIRSTPLDQSPDVGGISLMRWLLESLNQSLGTNFNGILVNRYNNGNDSIGKHSDDESALDKETSMVAGLAYGATRTFRIRDKKTDQILLDYPHQSGTLIVMQGKNFQKRYTHEIPVQKRVMDCRISVTFRHHLH